MARSPLVVDTNDPFIPHSAVRATRAFERPPGVVGVNPFDARLSLYNFKPENSARLAKAIASVMDGAFARLCVGGHSIPAGVPPLTPFPDAWPYRLTAALEAAGVPIAGEGPVVSNNNAAFNAVDSRWTLDANWQPLNPQIPYQLSAAGGATATFLSTRAGTIVELLYVDAGASFTVNIDGGGASPVVPTGSGDTILLPIGPVADTVHSIVVVSDAAFAFLPAIGVRDATGLSIVNVSFGGATTAMWQPGIVGGPDAAVEELNPACFFFECEDNDLNAAVPLVTFKTQTTATADERLTAATPGDVILVVDPPVNPAVFPGKDAYDSALIEVADALDIPLWHLQHHFGDWTRYTEAPSGAVDDAHADPVSHRDIARVGVKFVG